MISAPRRTWRRLALASLMSAAACSGNSVAPPSAEQLALSPGRSAILTDDTLRLSATIGAGAVDPIAVEWSSSAPAVAEVTAAGEVIGRSQGQATVTGSMDGATGQTVVQVRRGSGMRVAGMAAFDSIIPSLMNQWGIPGGAVAVVKDGRLVLARGYGWADEEAQRVVRPDALFRVASVSKPITAAAVLRLHDAGALELDMKAFSVLGDLEPPEGETEDPRLADITVRQLLHHSGGWNRDVTFDPMFRSTTAAEAVGAPAPASVETVIRYMRGQPLQFDPGTGYSYSNLGYAVLGRVIERVTGEAYETHVRENVLAPMGIERMRIGSSLLAGRDPDEVRYYDAATGPSVFPGGGVVPSPDGGFHLEAMDAHGAWIASVVDLLRMLTAVDPDVGGDLLLPSTVALMLAKPEPPLWATSPYHYGMGWLVRPAGADANWWHGGSLPGTTALVVRAHDGVAWAALFNARAGSSNGSFAAELDPALWRAVGAVSEWPEHDLFSTFEEEQ